MTVVSTLGRGAASGLTGALAWIIMSVLLFDTPDPRWAAVAGLVVGVLVAAATLTRLS